MLWKIKFIFEASIGMKTLSSRQVLLMKCTWHERTIRKRLNKYFLGRVVRRKLLLAKKNIATQLRLAKLRHETSKTKAFGHTRPKRRCLATTHSATLAQILHPTNKHDCFCSHKTRAPYSNWINHNPPCIYPTNSRMAPEETNQSVAMAQSVVSPDHNLTEMLWQETCASTNAHQTQRN